MDDLDALKGRKRPPKGSLSQFLLGLGMSVAGGYMFLTQVQVSSSAGFWGRTYLGGTITPFGATMVLFILGIVILFYDSDKIWGWLLAGGGLLIVIIGIIVNLRIYMASTSLYVLLVMLVLLFGGLGLMLRALRHVE